MASIETAIVGAGPYGLSIAAHLQSEGMSYRIFGKPMQTWREHMPQGMLLKSDGFASNLSHPKGALTLEKFCGQTSRPYHPTRGSVTLKTIADYGLEFQRTLVPELQEVNVSHIERVANLPTDRTTLQPRITALFKGGPSRESSAGYVLSLGNGDMITAQRVVVAVGITHFRYLPANLSQLPSRLLSHSSQVSSPAAYAGRDVVLIGGGSSAVDVAVLLHEAGARVHLVARRKAIVFGQNPGTKERSWYQKLRSPSSGLGPGLKSRFYTDFPLVFRLLPEKMRLQIVRSHLGPSAGWPMRDRAVGKFPFHLGTSGMEVKERGGKAAVSFLDASGVRQELLADHVIAATGYRPNINRLDFLSDGLRQSIRCVEDAPVLSANFESSVPGVYFVGISSANTFGPMMRFAYGADFTARRLTRHLGGHLTKHTDAHMVGDMVGTIAGHETGHLLQGSRGGSQPDGFAAVNSSCSSAAQSMKL